MILWFWYILFQKWATMNHTVESPHDKMSTVKSTHKVLMIRWVEAFTVYIEKIEKLHYLSNQRQCYYETLINILTYVKLLKEKIEK